eukprot:NODE_829_length_1164_cov_40.578592_g787_i0.p1 GENE.NODE_829_length_1164_cov_40.578592_g787_i0~~NODE_829_length_1164_cov_40.578592_g787_i0.p1  ORF type:complete len:330 (-),score=44.24 NODE_829_length_1164_cov_40.578592_g787_i0:58-1047(-)
MFLNIGSLNIDEVYQVQHIVKPGETTTASSFSRNPGGKGANQSVALARAGIKNVFHFGIVGTDGEWLKELMKESGVQVDFVKVMPSMSTGRAVIQVSESGENSIVLLAGANFGFTTEMIRKTFDDFLLLRSSQADHLWVTLQNEINMVPFVMRESNHREAVIVFNPVPITPDVGTYPLELVDILVVNEVEAEEILKARGVSLPAVSDIDEQHSIFLEKLIVTFKQANILFTRGGKGVLASFFIQTGDRLRFQRDAVATSVVDTTAAGDTFIGYFLAVLHGSKLLGTHPLTFSQEVVQRALDTASKAAALTVSRAGAMSSIPTMKELDGY